MELLFVTVIGIIIIWATFYISKKNEEKKNEELEKKKLSTSKINTPGAEKAKEKVPKQESLDSLYARSHGMWVCRRCETINDGGAIQCSACGAYK